MLRRAPAVTGHLPLAYPNEETKLQEVVLVRRRSGGGTVFHDLGNVNYSVICPTPSFNRDKHAEMVVRAIRKNNQRARVNERHDIVLDTGPLLDKNARPSPEDTHQTAYSASDGVIPAQKVSGSAYKLTRQRSLHHGTCLLASPNLLNISKYLRSPARPFLKARGVESVRSPISNVFGGLESLSKLNSAFQLQIVESFADLYGLDSGMLSEIRNETPNADTPRNGCLWGHLNDDLREVPEIKKGIKELEVT